ncbi:MAG: hypothetical protein JW936_04790 [Sedimentisphaerales bacterium]|nr:hypothetical protein [Sedimentisphaerales bacterium]
MTKRKRSIKKRFRTLGPGPWFWVSLSLSVLAAVLSEFVQQHGWKLGWCKLYLVLTGAEHRWLSWRAAQNMEKAAIVSGLLALIIAVAMLWRKSAKHWAIAAIAAATYATWICWTDTPLISN